MKGLELIRHRRSVRTFDGQDLRPEHLQQVLDCAESAENPYRIAIEWRILSAKADGLASPVISGTDTWIAGKVKQVPHAEEAFGYSFEKVVLYAESIGLGTTWIAGTMNRPVFEKAMNLQADEKLPCVSPLGYPAKKMALREVLMRKGVGADKRMKFEELFFSNSFDKPLSESEAGELAEPLEMVRWAPSAVNKQPWRVVLADGKAHFYEKRSRGYLAPDGWDLQKVDMGIALYHFEYGLCGQGKKPEFRIEDPDIPTPQDTFYIASYVL